MRRQSLRHIAVWALVGCVLALGVSGLQQGGCGDAPRVAVVTHVYDGDTVEVAGWGKVRLIGVDTLDGHNEEKMYRQARRLDLTVQQVKKWAERATEFTEEKVDDRGVRVRVGPNPRDDYGRTLAYLYLQPDGDEINFNRLLLEKGLALAYRRYRHPLRDEFIGVEKEARRRKAGLWSDATPPRQ